MLVTFVGPHDRIGLKPRVLLAGMYTSALGLRFYRRLDWTLKWQKFLNEIKYATERPLETVHAARTERVKKKPCVRRDVLAHRFPFATGERAVFSLYLRSLLDVQVTLGFMGV